MQRLNNEKIRFEAENIAKIDYRLTRSQIKNKVKLLKNRRSKTEAKFKWILTFYINYLNDEYLNVNQIF